MAKKRCWTYSDICMVVVRNKTTYFSIDLQNIQEKAKIENSEGVGGRILGIGGIIWGILGFLKSGKNLRTGG